jgi:hypothetical protein
MSAATKMPSSESLVYQSITSMTSKFSKMQFVASLSTSKIKLVWRSCIVNHAPILNAEKAEWLAVKKGRSYLQ